VARLECPRGSSPFEEAGFFRAIAESDARGLLIGRRALIALGIPVLTVDCDFWLHIDDIAAFNAAIEPMGLYPTHSPEEARARDRYVAENDERIDDLILTKRFGGRPKDFEDIRLLEALRREEGP
jgi:hypothetical protein